VFERYVGAAFVGHRLLEEKPCIAVNPIDAACRCPFLTSVSLHFFCSLFLSCTLSL
jgi:hypothetical protein